MKPRPALVLSPVVGTASEVLVASISSVVPSEEFPPDILLTPATERDRATNLKATSVLRLHTLATRHGAHLVRRLDHLSPEVAALVRRTLREWLAL